MRALKFMMEVCRSRGDCQVRRCSCGAQQLGKALVEPPNAIAGEIDCSSVDANLVGNTVERRSAVGRPNVTLKL